MPNLDQFSYRLTGNSYKPKLVFLHGLMGSWTNWRRISPSFEEDFHILAFDQRGHGRSFQPEKGYQPEDYADDLKAIIDELGWERVNLVGHSMGGRNAHNFSYRMPQRVDKLVIEDIGPDIDLKNSQKIKELIGGVPTPFGSKESAKAFFEQNFRSQVLGQYLLSNIRRIDEGRYDWRFHKAGVIQSVVEGRSRERWNEIEALKIPTLVIRGGDSEELSKEVFERMVECNALISGHEIPGCGHWVHYEKPDDFIRVTKSFLLGSS
jgi:pimeloyl-ACP methyl ester carboxylesterase